MGSSWDLSCFLSIQEATIMLMGMKMSHRLHMVSLFRDGLIKLMAILSRKIYGMIIIAASLFNNISFLPPISMSFISFHDYISMYAHDYYVLNLSLLYCMLKHRGRYLDEMMNIWFHWLYDFT
jgi:hypothetical protein